MNLADLGVRVLMITASRSSSDTSSYHAQGGVVYKGDPEPPGELSGDILRAGAFAGDREMIEILADNGPGAVERLLFRRLNINFDRDAAGGLALAREAAHSRPRIIHSRDATGRVIMEALQAAVADHPGIELVSGCAASELLVSGGCCAGVETIGEDGGLQAVRARAVVLATGGAGSLFSRTSNPRGIFGSGFALAGRAGAWLENLEYIQFHPTALAIAGREPFLVSEAVRGAGARLVSADNVPFMQKYDPEWKDLAPRDVVTRAIWTEMNDEGLSNVFLNLFDYLPGPEIIERFPTIYDRCLACGVDLTTELLPVAPAAHFACGGIRVDGHAETDIRGLYAVGECSCTGVHGANRLASTSLLEGIVWAERAACRIAGRPAPAGSDVIPPGSGIGRGAEEAGPDIYDRLRVIGERVRGIMWEKVGIERTAEALSDAVGELESYEVLAAELCLKYSADIELAAFRDMCTASVLIAGAALENGVSRGCHYVVSCSGG